MPAPLAVGVDVGGTKILSGLVDADGHILRTSRRPTPRSAEDLVSAIVAAIGDVTGEGDGPLPLGCGFPGLVTRHGIARYGPNISLREFGLRDALITQLGSADVVVENDANAAAWAEFAVGAGRAVHDTMAMFTLGTGVGGGLVIGGRLHRGANGFGGELGHIVLEVDGEPSASGIHGVLEAYASGTAVERMATQAQAEGRLVGTPLDGPTSPIGQAVTDAARDGVPVAVEILATVGRYLGLGAAAIVNALDPELVVVGGGAGAAGELVLGPARTALRAHLMGAEHRPEVPLVSALLGPEAGLVGVALLALEAAGGA